MGFFVKLGLLIVLPAVWAGIFGLVTVLPWGLDEVFQVISNTISVVYTVIPLLEAPFEFFMIAMGIKIVLLVWSHLQWITQLIAR